jgi:hypothetical protein
LKLSGERRAASGEQSKQRMANGEWRMVENSEGRKTAKGEWRMANGEWWEAANGE